MKPNRLLSHPPIYNALLFKLSERAASTGEKRWRRTAFDFEAMMTEGETVVATSTPPGDHDPALALLFDDEKRLRTVWRVSLFLVVALGADTILQLVIAIPFFVAIVLSDPALSEPGNNAELTETIESWTPELLMVSAPFRVLVALAVVYCFRRWLDRRPFRSVGFDRPTETWPGAIGLGLLAGAAPIAVVAGSLMLMNLLTYQGWTISVTRFILFIPGLLLAAFFEELVFRGYLLRNIADAGRPWLGIVFNSIVFWLVHALNPSAWQSPLVAVNLFLAGVLLSLAYLATRSLWFATFLHFAWNFAQGPLFGIPVSGIKTGGAIQLTEVGDPASWLTGADFGFEASLLASFAASVVILLLGFIWMSRERQSTSVAAAPQTEEPPQIPTH